MGTTKAKAAHTPGPFIWKTDGTMTGRGPGIYAVNEKYDDGSMRKLATLETSAVNPTRKRWRRKPDADEIEANADLFAAAPDLLAACQRAVERLSLAYSLTGGRYCTPPDEESLLEQLTVAIAKAEGTA